MKTMEERLLEDIGAVDKKADSMNTTQSIAFVTLAELGQIDAVTCAEHSDMFPKWVPKVYYKEYTIVKHNGFLYQVLSGKGHTSQLGWEPDIATSLWDNIADPTVEYPAWSQPIGAHDAYDEGDKVTHLEKKWVSTVPNNVWEPSVYGWEEVFEETL